MNPNLQSQLAQLRDIRVPQEIGLWPLAPGWWTALALIVIALIAFIIWRVRRRYGARYLALQELDALPTDDPRQFATGVSTLLRRVARLKEEAVAQLSGKSWADYLSARGLASDYANYLAEATYAARPSVTATSAELRSAAENWIRSQT